MRFLLILCLVVCINANAQYQSDSGSVAYIQHLKSYKCKLSLRRPYNNILNYNGYLYRVDSNQIICSNVQPHLINPKNFHHVIFSKFFPENVDAIALNKVGGKALAVPVGFAEGIVLGAAIAANDETFRKYPNPRYKGILILS